MKLPFAVVVVVLMALISVRGETVYTPGNGVAAPRIVRQVRPVYPAQAEQTHKQGRVSLDCVVGTDGMVTDVSIKETSDDVFSDAAVAAAWQYQFEPGTKDGKPVPVRVSVEVTFTLHQARQPVRLERHDLSRRQQIDEALPTDRRHPVT